MLSLIIKKRKKERGFRIKSYNVHISVLLVFGYAAAYKRGFRREMVFYRSIIIIIYILVNVC